MNSVKNEIRNHKNNIYDIEIFDLTKIYPLKGRNKSIKALDNINLKVKRGEIFGLLGPNGAGKTTMVSILTTLLQPTSGYAIILGRPLIKEAWFVRENVGLMLGGEMIYNVLTGYRNLKFFSKLYGIKDYKRKINELAELFNLKKWLNQYASTYSKGMKLKLGLMRVLLIEPKILFLDEPMLGLDPKSVSEVIDILKNLNSTILLTSHQMHIVSRICDRIAFIKEGKILKIDTDENFKRLISEKIKLQLEIIKNDDKFINSLKKLHFVSDINENENRITFYIRSRENFPYLFEFLKDYRVISFNEITPTLDDVFIKLTG
ncbi:MAG: ATP-binding cassette domain-containing protein [Promethearchaeota archaeon]